MAYLKKMIQVKNQSVLKQTIVENKILELSLILRVEGQKIVKKI